MTNPTHQQHSSNSDDELKQIFFDLIDKHFPKGKCKERGAAMVLVAEALLAVHARDKALIQRVEAEVIGKDDVSGGLPGYTHREQYRNDLRAQQRTALNSLITEKDNT